MALALTDARGRPTVRTVLIKGIDERGIAFVTQALGEKGKRLATKPIVAASMHWPSIATQISIQGKVRTLPKVELQTLWDKRDRDAQILYHLGIPQSKPVESFATLRRALQHGRKQWAEHEHIPLSPNYVGYIIVPQRLEILSHTSSRLNKRELFTKRGGEWRCQILAP